MLSAQTLRPVPLHNRLRLMPPGCLPRPRRRFNASCLGMSPPCCRCWAAAPRLCRSTSLPRTTRLARRAAPRRARPPRWAWSAARQRQGRGHLRCCLVALHGLSHPGYPGSSDGIRGMQFLFGVMSSPSVATPSQARSRACRLPPRHCGTSEQPAPTAPACPTQLYTQHPRNVMLEFSTCLSLCSSRLQGQLLPSVLHTQGIALARLHLIHLSFECPFPDASSPNLFRPSPLLTSCMPQVGCIAHPCIVLTAPALLALALHMCCC